jgi:hypothetical protein
MRAADRNSSSEGRSLGYGCSSASVMRDDVKLQKGEQRIKEHDNAVWVRGTFNNVVGKLVLTNQRLAFERRSILQSSVLGQFGLVGNIADEVLPRSVVVNVPLGQLAAFAQVRVVSSRKVLPIITRRGEELLFSGPKFEQWAPALLQVGLVEAGQPSSAPNSLPYAQQPPQSAQTASQAGYAPPQRQAPAKSGIPWWGWVLIAGAIVLFACGALILALAALGSAVGGTTTSGVAAALAWLPHFSNVDATTSWGMSNGAC